MDLAPQAAILVSSVFWAAAAALFVHFARPIWDGIARRHIADLTPAMRDLNMDASKLPAYLRWWGVAMLAAGVLVAVAFGSPLLAIPTIFIIYQAPRFLVRSQIARRRILLRDQMVGACTALANTARAGLALPQGLEAVAPETPEPLAAEFRRTNHDFQRGRPFADCLRDAQKRLNLDGFTLFASAILVCLERGGKVTEALERIGRSLQEHQRLERKLEADTASGRKVVLILAFCPAIFLAGFYLLDPAGTGLIFTTLVGQITLVVVGILVYVSVQWARRILGLNVT
jgi:tight adherence protein B